MVEGDEIVEKLSALSFELLQFEREHKKRYEGLVRKFNELQDEILKKFRA